MVENRKTFQITVYIIFSFLNCGHDQVLPKRTKIMTKKTPKLPEWFTFHSPVVPGGDYEIDPFD